MVLAIRRGGQCAPCAFRSAGHRIVEWAARNGKRQFSASYARFGILEDLLPARNHPLQENRKKAIETKPRDEERDRGALNEDSIPRNTSLANEESYKVIRRNGERPRQNPRPSQIYTQEDPVLRESRSGTYSISINPGLRQEPPPIRRDVSRGSRSIFFQDSRPSRDGTQPSARPFEARLRDNPEVIYGIAAENFKRLRTGLGMTFMSQNPAESRVGEFAGIKTEEEFNRIADDFADSLKRSCDAAMPKNQSLSEEFPGGQNKFIKGDNEIDLEDNSHDVSMFRELEQAILTDRNSVIKHLRHLFIKHICDAQISEQTSIRQARFADLRFPIEWFPATRAMQRKIHLHVGPTNSGKTYHALQRLEQAESGVYAGPLRLLAHEVYSRLNANGKPCSLITGEERRIPEGPKPPTMSSCTVEMVPLNTEVEVAVIDEIQMLGDVHRGWAWTQAFLGIKAKEVHLCGELRTIPLIEDLCKLMGDELTIHRYERLTPLECMGKSLNGKLDKLKKGDCIILFSRVAIHAMKKEVEKITGKRCAVVYGSLPPETRAQQAALFNDPNNEYDFLVASDAVGMGLNLAIRRVIFESLAKFDGKAFSNIPVSEVKQIGGRAGRYKTAADAINGETNLTGDVSDPPPRRRNVGLVTTLDPIDHPLLKRAMEADVQPLKTAAILPPSSVLQKFAAYFPKGTPLSYIMMRLNDVATTNPLFSLCELHEQLLLADVIEPYDITIQDRLIFIAAPANVSRKGQRPVIEAFASLLASQSSADLLDIPELDLEVLDHNFQEGKEYLGRLEKLHQGISLYLWLSYRFAGVYRNQALAFHIKSLVEKKIDESLATVHFKGNRRQVLQALKKRALQQQLEKGPLVVEADTKWQDASNLAQTPLSYEDEDRQEPLMDMPGEDDLLEEDNEDEDLEDTPDVPDGGKPSEDDEHEGNERLQKPKAKRGL